MAEDVKNTESVKPEDIRYIIIPEEVMQKVMDHLGEKPAKEVMELVTAIQTTAKVVKLGPPAEGENSNESTEDENK